MLMSLLDLFLRKLDSRIYSLLEGNFIVSEFQKQVRKKHYKSQKSEVKGIHKGEIVQEC